MDKVWCDRSRFCTGGEVVGLVAGLGLAVQFLLGQFVQQALVLIPLTMGLRRPLLDKVGRAGHAVTLHYWRYTQARKEKHSKQIEGRMCEKHLNFLHSSIA